MGCLLDRQAGNKPSTWVSCKFCHSAMQLLRQCCAQHMINLRCPASSAEESFLEVHQSAICIIVLNSKCSRIKGKADISRSSIIYKLQSCVARHSGCMSCLSSGIACRKIQQPLPRPWSLAITPSALPLPCLHNTMCCCCCSNARGP